MREMELTGHILTGSGWLAGRIQFENKIISISAAEISGSSPKIVPGFIDVHVHGGGGHDTMDGTDGIRGLAEFHAKHGTTSLLATTITNPWENILLALNNIKTVMQNQSRTTVKTSAHILGAHLEGPFISPHKLGAQPAFAIAPTEKLVQEIIDTEVLRVVTLAPELAGTHQAAKMLTKAGIRISLGHTVSNAETAQNLMLNTDGVFGATHLFNAMGNLEARNPGVVGAMLANPNAFAEIILDGFHVHTTSFLAALTAKPNKTMLVTDAIRAAGMPDGAYDLGGQTAHVQNGVARLSNGTLAGSVLTMVSAVKNAVGAGLNLETAVRLASLHPARYLGLSNKGELKNGADADIVVLNNNLDIEKVFVMGQEIEPNKERGIYGKTI